MVVRSISIDVQIGNEVEVGCSSHPGHKSELETVTDDAKIRLNFSSEEAFDNFYKGFQSFYEHLKRYYASREEFEKNRQYS